MGSIRVLHVDDEPNFAELTATYLQREDESFDVTVETNASDGLDRLSEQAVDCIVSDYQMPGLDGLEFLERVREKYPDLPFVLFTGEGSEGIASAAIAAGATDYLRKTSGTEQYEVLANRIRNAVDQYRANDRAANLERVRTLVGDLNQALVRATAREELEADVCDIISDSEPYSFVWIGEVDAETDQIQPRASAGMKDGYLDRVTITADDTPTGRGPGGTAIRERRMVVSQDIQSDPQFEPWRDAVEEYRLRSVAAVPLIYEDDLYGLLVVYTDRPEAFDEDERALLSELGDDVAHAIHAVELRSELERYETIVESLGSPVYALDERGHYTFVNEAFVEQTGYTRDDILGEHVSRVLAESDIRRGREVIKNLLEGEESTATFEVDGRAVDGQRRRIENSVGLLPPEDGEFSGTAGVLRDVTDQKRREQQLEKTTSKLEALVEATPIPIVQIDTDRRVELWNSAAEELFGWEREEILGRELPILPDSADNDFGETFERVLDGQQVNGQQVTRRTKDGSHKELLLSAAPVREGGEIVGSAGVFVDIDDRLDYERTVEQLHSATRDLIGAETESEVLERGQRVVVETLGFELTAIRIHDPETGILRRRSGSNQSIDLMGERPQYDVETSPLGKAFRTDESVLQRIGFDDEYGRDELFEALYVPIPSRGVISIGTTDADGFTDADVKLAEILAANIGAALAEAERERDLRRQNERLEEFTSIVSHDLRSPLNVATGRLEIAREECNSPHLDGVAQAHERMETLIEDLLTLARHGEPIAGTATVDLGRLARECWQTVETAGAQLVVETDQVIQADEGRLRQLFENLFRNAIEHGSTGRSTQSDRDEDGSADVTITVGPLEDGFYVEDDGLGIPESERERVFESGYSSADEGTGFGLSIVEQIVHAHDWDVRVTESDAGGARFEVTGVDEN
jgi:PAS domain S-box-containing protein